MSHQIFIGVLAMLEDHCRLKVVIAGANSASREHLTELIPPFRSLSDTDLQVLLEQRWAPPGIHLPCTAPEPEVIEAVIRLTRGNFRLLVRLLTQMERVLTINSLKTLSVDVVETARENLVIGQA